MTQIFFLDLDIELIESNRLRYPDQLHNARHCGRRDTMEDLLDYEPQELRDYEGKTQENSDD